MLFASYQPLIQDDAFILESEAMRQLVDMIGYFPYFCFPAERLEDVLVHSFMTAVDCPEKIVFFETDDFCKLDCVEWHRLLKMERDGIPIDVRVALGNVDEMVALYLVPEFENVCFEVSLYEALHTCFSIDFVDEDTRNAAEGWLAFAQGTASKLVAETKVQAEDEFALELAQLRLQKNVFEIFILPVLYVFMISGRWEDLGTMLNVKMCLDDPKILQDLKAFHDPSAGMDMKTRERFLRIFRVLKGSVCHGGGKPARNALCPCGSGKKYKRCCGCSGAVEVV